MKVSPSRVASPETISIKRLKCPELPPITLFVHAATCITCTVNFTSVENCVLRKEVFYHYFSFFNFNIIYTVELYNDKVIDRVIEINIVIK